MNENNQVLWEKKASLCSVDDIAKQVVSYLKKEERTFCLWLQGNLGAGKTTFTKSFLYELGLPTNEPVTSPTYTYLQEYDIKGLWYAHMDFYRFSKGASFDEEELIGIREYSGYILEWPNQVDLPTSLQASHKLELELTEENTRKYKFIKVNSSD